MRIADANAHCNSHTDAYGHSNRDGDIYFHAQSNADAKASANTKDAAHPAAAPVTCIYEKETRYSTPTLGREHAKNFGVRFFESVRSDLVGVWLCTCYIRLRRRHYGHQHKRQRLRFIASSAR